VFSFVMQILISFVYLLSACACSLLHTCFLVQSEMDASGRSWLLTQTFWPSLLQCKQLTSLSLGDGLSIAAGQFEHLVKSLPKLNNFLVQGAFIESTTPLAAAPTLLSLMIYRCHSLDGSPLHLRTSLPAMPLLTTLKIIDVQEERLSTMQAEPLNATLLQRMPLLTAAAQFKQNLLGVHSEHSSSDSESEC
jgi:hypothetical protein